MSLSHESDHPEAATAHSTDSGPREAVRQPGLRALAQILPSNLDHRLKSLVESAVETCRRRGFRIYRLLRPLSSDRYADAEFHEALSLLTGSSPGKEAQAAASAWLLGVAPLRPDHRIEAASALGIILRKPARAYRLQGYNRVWRALCRTVSFSAPLSILAMTLMLYCYGAISDPYVIDDPHVIFVLVSSFFGLLTAIGFPVMLVCQHLCDAQHARGLRFLAAHTLGRLGVPQGVGPLCSACLDHDSQLQEMAECSLHALLPTLTPEHYGRLESETVPNLCALLLDYTPFLTAPRFEFCVKLLEALEKVGDSRALPTVRQLASRGQHGRLKEAAERVLPILEYRRQLEVDRETLLRGTGQPAVNPTELLRPGTGQAESKSEELLRPLN